VECLVLLLAELKDSDLPGDFFLELLQVRTHKRTQTHTHTHRHKTHILNILM
jgi:hypothetical protein